MSESPDTSAVAIIQDHAFEPRTKAQMQADIALPDGFSVAAVFSPNEFLCRHCRLAEAAHIR
jgi:hypothetical protein